MVHENIVVVGVDGTDASLGAIEWGLAQARERNAELRLVCVYEVPSYAAHILQQGRANLEEESQIMQQAAHTMLEDLAKKYQNQGVEISCQVLKGDAAEELVNISKKVALMVVGGRVSQHGSIADRILRTVSTALPAFACCPTVVVPHENFQAHLPVKKIAVGVDGSDTSKLALQRAIWEADRWNAELIVMNAVNLDSFAGIPQFSYFKEYFTEIHATIEEQLAEVSEGRLVKVKIQVTQGNPVENLVKLSQSCDLLILGTRGRGGFSGLLLGSTAQSVLEHSACPTFVVPRRVKETDDVGPSPRG